MILCFSALANYWVEKIGLLKGTCVHSLADYRKTLKNAPRCSMQKRENAWNKEQFEVGFKSIKPIDIKTKKTNMSIDVKSIWKVSNHTVFTILSQFAPFLYLSCLRLL
jgi:hypothetical protein